MNKENYFNQGLQKFLVLIFIGGFLYITGVTNVLGGFWRTLNNIDSAGVSNTSQFLLGYGYGDDGWGDGYGYGYGYGTYGEGYYVEATCGTAFKTFDSDDTDWGTTTFCAQGYATPSSPIFPVSGSSTTWTCESGSSSVSCSADKGGSSSSGGSGGGGGGGASQQDSCPNGDYTSSVYDGKCGTAPKQNTRPGTGGTTNPGGSTNPMYTGGVCEFNDGYETIKIIGIPTQYAKEVKYHTNRCTIKGREIGGKNYLMPYNNVALTEAIKIIARLNPDWFTNIETFDEKNYNPWYINYKSVLSKKGLLKKLAGGIVTRNLNYYDFMTILLNRLELEEVIDADKKAEVMNGLSASWKLKTIKRIKFLRILAFIDYNLKK